MKTWVVVVIALAGDLLVAFGDIFARRWVSAGVWSKELLLAGLCYAGVTTLWMAMLRTVGELGRAGILWAASGAIVPVVLGYFVFHEPVPWNMKLAMVLCAGGMALAALK